MENDAAAADAAGGDATRDTTRLTTCSRASSIAAAAADTDPDLPDVSLQHQEDVAALIEHAEALERETAALRGRLAVAEQTERTLRARLGEKDHETHELKTRLTMTGGTDREKDGRFKASTADVSDDDESRVASLKARLASSEAELERVRRASRERVESMEKEVELYFEMAEEMKRTMRGDGVC